MKNNDKNVKPLMTYRINAEQKRLDLTNDTIAEKLGISSEHYSRLKNGNGKKGFSKDKLEILCDLFGVRQNYILGIDSVRRDSEFLRDIKSDKEIEQYAAVISFMKVLGYEIEIVELLVISPLIISTFDGNVDTELDYIDPYIANNKDLWNFVKNTAHTLHKNKAELTAFPETLFCFELSGDPFAHIQELDILPDYDEDYDYDEDENYDFCEIMKYVGYYARITKNGVLVGYVSEYRKIFDIIKESAKSMFETWLKVYRAEIIKNIDVNLDPNNDLPFM